MKTILVDDEYIILKQLENYLKNYEEIDLKEVFTSPSKALEYAKDHEIDFAVLDVEMPGIGGIHLGKELRKLYPDMILIYVTGYRDYLKEAIFDVKADYYIVKPYNEADIKDMVQRAVLLSGRLKRKVRFETFGRFNVFIDGELIHFSNAKAKELLALCIDHEGGYVSMEEAIDKLWSDRPFDEKTKNLYRKAVSYCKRLFIHYGCDNILQNRRGYCFVKKQKVNCDLFDQEGRQTNTFEGNYMEDYEWAREKEAMLTMKYLYHE